MRASHAVLSIIGVFLFAAGAVRPARAQQVITCSSDDGKRNYCPADTRGGVSMGRQRSGSRCDQGRGWGYDRNGVWVDHGCRADFVLNAYNNRPGFGNGWNGGNNGSGQTITCSSDDGKRHYCSGDTSRGVQMTNQRSGSPCTQNYSWGYDRRGVWVDRGCRADFLLNTGGRPGFLNGVLGGSNGSGQTITCSSDDGKRHYCNANTSRGVQMTNQRSGSPCTQNYSWGYDGQGVWVDRGCRADFLVR